MWQKGAWKFGLFTLVAGLLAFAVLIPGGTQRVLVGRPGDAAAVGGFSLGSVWQGHAGRWTRGDGRIAFADAPVPGIVTLALGTLPERLPDAVEIVVNDSQIQRVTLTQVRQTIELAVAPRRRGGATTVAVRSATTLRGAVPQGVFVEEVTLTTGGLRGAVGVRRLTFVALTIAFLALMFALASILRGQYWVLWGTGVLLAWGSAVVFRPVLLAHAPVVALLAVIGAAAVIGVEADGRGARRLVRLGERRAGLLFGLAAVAILIALLPEAFLHGRVLSQADMLYDALPWRAHLPPEFRPVIDRPPLGDIPMLVYPFLSFTAARWWSGHFPIWTASIASGQPFLATYHPALFSPFTWLAMLMPLTYGTVAMAVARLLVGGVGMFLFLRRRDLSLSPWAAAFGGVTYLLNPLSLVVLEHPYSSVLTWLPWLLFAAEAAMTGRALAIAGLALVTALTIVAGHPHGGVFVAGFGAAYAILLALTRAPPARARAIISVVAALCLGGLLACVQVLPFVEYLSLSRAATQRASYGLNPFIAPVSTLMTALVPNFLGHPGSGNFIGPTNYLEQQIYPGMLTWLLAPLGVLAGLRRWRTWFFVASTVLVMLAMYGAPGMLQLISMVPLLKAASLPRLAIIAIASLTVLAATGADVVLRRLSVRSSLAPVAPIAIALVPIGTAALLLVTIATVFMTRHAELDAHALVDFVTRWIWLAAFLLAAGCFILVARLTDAIRLAPAGLALVALAAFDLLLFGRGFHPTLPPDQVFPPMPEIDRIREDHDLFRVLGIGNALLPNSAMVYGLQDVRGVDGLGVARYEDLLDVVLATSQSGHIATSAASIAHAPLLDLLNVKYVLAPADAAPPDGWTTAYRDAAVNSAVWRNDRVYPRAWLVDSYVVLEGNAARRALRDAKVDGRRVAILEQDPPAAERPAAAPTAAHDAAGIGMTRIDSYEDERVIIETDAPGPRLLVLTDVHYPGWTAHIDDQPATIHRANFAFRAVSVPAGRHRVEFRYRPASFYTGVGLAVAACAVLAGLVLRERYFRLI